jgi:sterol desaturase/sphingolipid hydroxylase (fatty acid hydroxylase superfamily)
MPLLQKLQWSFQAAQHTAIGYALWYGALALVLWLLFYIVLHKAMANRKISRKQPSGRQISREVLYSLRSIVVFGLVTVPVVCAALSGWTRFYVRIDDRGWLWFFVSIGVMIVMHDTYFYWTHRLMHHRRLYRVFHRTHHLSTDPTPWAAYSFSTLEAAVQAGIGPLIVFTLPVHPTAFAIFMIWQISFNVLGHCGYEIFPQWFLRMPIGFFLNSPTHHGLHHEKFLGNFSLYFNVWDRLMGTNHPEYAARFAKTTGGALAQSSSAHSLSA